MAGVVDWRPAADMAARFQGAPALSKRDPGTKLGMGNRPGAHRAARRDAAGTPPVPGGADLSRLATEWLDHLHRAQSVVARRILGRLGIALRATRGVRSAGPARLVRDRRSEEHTSELQSRLHLVCRLLLEKKKKNKEQTKTI